MKMGSFCDSESQKLLTQREKSSGFLVMCQLCPIFMAASLLEFLSPVSAF